MMGARAQRAHGGAQLHFRRVVPEVQWSAKPRAACEAF